MTLEEQLVHALDVVARPVVEMCSKKLGYDVSLERSVPEYPDMKARLKYIDKVLARASEQRIRDRISKGHATGE